MAAVSDMLYPNSCRNLCGYFKVIFKTIILLGMCGMMYSLSTLTSREPKSAVVHLTEENFDHLVVFSKEPWLVEFSASWCPHCNAFAEDYIKIGEILEGIVKVGIVNVGEERSLKIKYGVRSLPSFFIFHQNKTSPVMYQGPRAVEDIVRMVLNVVDWKP